ncbi:hypothetical protein CFP56_006809 [Quercus suber]|uniref:Uncharacterized protein n=1 Tax=Quercus suber TaxID=58331 RepID=A0AAW0M5Y8_QUESU
MSFHSTPVLSLVGSPSHSHSSVGRHSSLRQAIFLDSEVTSLAPSSPTKISSKTSLPCSLVQSPSHDSHDGEKTTMSFHSTPVLSLVGSPSHSHSSVGRHSSLRQAIFLGL